MDEFNRGDELTSQPLTHEPAIDGTPPDDGRIEVSVPRGPLIGLLLLNTLLNIVTLGFYRFWARTKVRQRLWAGVSLQGEPFTYTGTGKELFVGFLVALVLLLPFVGIVTLVNSLIPPTDIGKQMLVQIGFGLGAGLLGLAALYFARRYLLTRTRWRGIHGSQDKVLGPYLLVHLKAYLPVLLTLGLLQPAADAKTYNYRTSITWFGTERFRANASTRGLWALWLPTWLLFAIGYGVMIYAIWPYMEWSAAAQAAQAMGEAPPPPPAPFPLVSYGVSIVMILLAVAGFFLYVIRRSIAFLGATQLGEMLFDLRVGLRQVIYIPLVGTGIYVVVTGLCIAGIAGLSALLGPKNMVGVLLVPLLFLFVMLSLFSVVSVAWTQLEVLRVIGRHLRLRNMGMLDELLNRGQPAPTRGEGLADAIGDIGIGA